MKSGIIVKFGPMETTALIKTAAEYLKGRIEGRKPETGIILGSGLGDLADQIEDSITIPYGEIPGFPISTAIGHKGNFIVGKIAGKIVCAMQGRFHYYEGYDYEICTFYVRVMANLNVKTLLLTNAAGGLGEDMKPTDLMLIEDHISFFCESPLRGPNLDEYGVRFPDVSEVYDRNLANIMIKCAEDLNIRLCKGVYCYTKGPQYETPAEIQVYKSMGAGAVGMSTVPEAIVAAHCGIKVAAVSCVTNLAAGISPNPLSHEEVMVNAAKASDNSCNLVKAFISKL